MGPGMLDGWAAGAASVQAGKYSLPGAASMRARGRSLPGAASTQAREHPMPHRLCTTMAATLAATFPPCTIDYS